MRSENDVQRDELSGGEQVAEGVHSIVRNADTILAFKSNLGLPLRSRLLGDLFVLGGWREI